MSSANFEYLREGAPVLAELGAFAEQYLKSDPDSALTKLRGFCEASVKLLYQHQGWSVPERFTLDQLIRESEFTDAYPSRSSLSSTTFACMGIKALITLVHRRQRRWLFFGRLTG